MRLGIVSRIDIPEIKDVIEEVIRVVGTRAELVLEPEMVRTYGLEPGSAGSAGSAGEGFTESPVEEMDVDIVVTIGGDGTILRTLNLTDLPLLTVNMGTVGFLAEVDVDRLEEQLERFFAGEYHLDRRNKLMVNVNGHRQVDAVNEAVLNTAHLSKMKHFRILVDDFEADRYRSDGLIVATATGSTCYAMSAGAPILDPRVFANVLVPIAPFRLSARPIVVPVESEIEVQTLDSKSTLLVVDGERLMELDSKDIVTFRKSEKEARFVRFEKNFFKQVWRKLTI